MPARNLDASVEHKGEAGEVTLAFVFHGAVLDQAIADVGAPPLPPYIASKRAPDDRDAADYQTIFAAEEGAVAAPTAGLHFTSELGYRAARPWHRPASLDASCRRGNLSAGEGGRYRRSSHACGVGHARARNRRRAQRGAGQGRSHRRGRYHVAAVLESAAREDGSLAPFASETSIFITPVIDFAAVDVLMTNFPPARDRRCSCSCRIQRPRCHAAGLCPRDPPKAIGLFLRRCLAVVSPAGEPMTLPNHFRLLGRDGRGANRAARNTPR